MSLGLLLEINLCENNYSCRKQKVTLVKTFLLNKPGAQNCLIKGMSGVAKLLAQELSICVQCRSALEPLGKAQMSLITVKASLQVKAANDNNYKIFASEAGDMVKSLQAFLERAHTVCPDADTYDASADDAKMKAISLSLKAQTTCAEHHKIGSSSAVSRFQAILGLTK